MELLAGLSTREIRSTRVERQILVISHGLNLQPRRTTTPARMPRRGPRFRSVALFRFELQEQERFRIAKFGLRIRRQRPELGVAKSVIRISQSEILLSPSRRLL